ncbi:anaerobic ribonucleoside-triphosphate reductase activating protein [Clostridium sp. YIM B02515]|uniref:Anaerobic ribonucleoside-triphosphate reductase-activating protein n=1 Tax=Clostridium rhizosphaerae TaxID=2803861 RepID=A0ABS1T9K7_9CLOT|nr:anaerobic ribonucleoside-triphosphate reductase activating protein [Clostridium rhizosphaerae]MBL4936033.1 anaerobic ribonucleoside-triphosphate reductase activating protein [Clostridium rhizosphaerae]
MKEDNTIRLAAILPESLVNGIGIRRVLFAQGCPHNCKGCFSPHTHSYTDGELLNMDKIIEDIRNNPLLKGVTFSGGEPWEQADKFAYIAKEVKKFGLNVWCYTGYTFEYILEHQYHRQGWNELLSYVDILVDGKFEEAKKDSSLRFRGSSNQRIIDVQGSLEVMKAVALDVNK